MFRPHDLLWVADSEALHATEQMPPWASTEWIARAPVVVRRERVEESALIPVGLRGKERNERMGAYLKLDGVMRCVTPEMLASQAAWRTLPFLASLPATEALDRIASRLIGIDLTWGPTGSMGFALASELPVVREQSDLDILVRCDTPFMQEEVQQLKAVAVNDGCRIDIQVETGYGGFAFAEWIRSKGRVLLKTGIGAFLTNDPWNRTGWLQSAGKVAA
jgi:phosphoribosyl-dephospho-CoA transferase